MSNGHLIISSETLKNMFDIQQKNNELFAAEQVVNTEQQEQDSSTYIYSSFWDLLSKILASDNGQRSTQNVSLYHINTIYYKNNLTKKPPRKTK